MSKAFVVKGADYSATKIKTVEFLIQIPCESITLSESSLLLNTLESQTLTATVLPVDCTDVLTWESSDTGVVSVNDGVLTINGLGTATVTATCGEQSATCTISVDNVVITAFEWGSAENVNGNDNFGTGYVPNNYARVYYADKVPLGSTRKRLLRNANFVGDFNLAPMILPNGVGSVRLESANVSGMYYVLFYDSTQSSSQEICALIVGKNRPYAPSNGLVDATYNVTEGADSFTVGLTYKTTYSADVDVNDVVAEKGTKITLIHDAVNVQ